MQRKSHHLVRKSLVETLSGTGQFRPYTLRLPHVSAPACLAGEKSRASTVCAKCVAKVTTALLFP